MSPREVGIEKINCYGGGFRLDHKKLAVARGLTAEQSASDYMIDHRAVYPPYEDAVTLGANAAKKVMEGIDPSEIGMLIVGTESSIDFGKPISTNLHEALNLPPSVRNFETKHACYSGAAALDTGINWVASGLNRGRKALIVATDFSRSHLNMKEELVLGGCAAAVIISDTPKVVSFELQHRGTWTTNVYDTFRPTATLEVGNNEVSLFTYMDAISQSYEDYCTTFENPIDFYNHFKYIAYHTPFPAIAWQAHRTICNLERKLSKAEMRQDFETRVVPSLRLAKKIGSTYGCSVFTGICSTILDNPSIKAGERLGLYSYGSGAIGEFYSALACEGAYETVKAMQIEETLAARKDVTVELYEEFEKTREKYIDVPSFAPDLKASDNWFEKFYAARHYYHLVEVKDFYRTYAWG